MSYTSLFLEEFWPSRALLITFWAPVPWVAELMDHVIEPLTFWMSKMIMKIFSMMLWTWVQYCERFLWKGVMIRCWWLDVGDRISILVTYFECWCPTPTRKEIGWWWQKWPNCFQHLKVVSDNLSPTHFFPAFVTNIFLWMFLTIRQSIIYTVWPVF